MRRGYIEAHCDLTESFKLARAWASDRQMTVMAPSTSAVEASPWLAKVGVTIGVVSNRHSRFSARPQGTVIAWCLHLDEVLEIEHRYDLDGMVLVRALKSHAPWITAHEADHLGGEVIPPLPEAPTAIKKTVKGISLLPVLNQGLIDSRERSTAVQALTFLRDRGHQLVPDELATEAIRNDWPGQSPLELAKIARDLNAGKRLRFQQRLRPEVLVEWANA